MADVNNGEATAEEMDVDGGAGAGKCLSSYVDRGTAESHRYYLSRRTLLEMLRDRGYEVPSQEIDMTLEQFRSFHGQDPDVERLRISATHSSDSNNKILAVYCGPGVVKVNVIRGITSQITNKDGLSRLIIVVQSKITNQASKAVELFPFKVELFEVTFRDFRILDSRLFALGFRYFEITDLLVNITKHSLKPKHRVITDKEKEKLLKKYNLEAKQLPRMSQKDAIAQYYGLEKGQVLEVTYNSEITGFHVTYRCVW